MITKRPPRPALRPFIETLWVTDETGTRSSSASRREHVLPTGLMHLVLRLGGNPLRLFENGTDTPGETVGDALVGGARASFYTREVSGPLCSVGAQLRPGAAEALFGVPAGALAERHTRLDDLWGAAAASIRDRLSECPLQQRLDLFEGILAARLPRARGLHPAVAQALEQFETTSNVRTVVRDSGCSHRTFIALFRRSVGLTPKRHCRVSRFVRGLQRIAAGHASWADLASAAGYSDQAHFNREFREFAGVTPGEYERIAPRFPHHVAIRRGRF